MKQAIVELKGFLFGFQVVLLVARARSLRQRERGQFYSPPICERFS